MRRRRRRVSRLEVFFILLIAALMAGASLWLDRNGVPVTGRVAAKQERIVVGREPSGGWRRSYEVVAAFELPGGDGSQATVRVSPERYHSLRAGDPIELRYLPQFPLLARTTDRSTLSVASEIAWGLAGIPILIWVVGGFVALWVAARLGTIPVVAAGAAWLVAGYSLLLSPPSREGPRPGKATAQVRGITLVDKSPSRVSRSSRRSRGRSKFNRSLEVPYQVVELMVPVRGGRDTVLAVDAVDSGSVAGLSHGAVLPVRLDPAAPREAQLAGGTRRFVEANRYHFRIPVVGGALLGTLAALTYRWRRRKRQTIAQDDTVARQGAAIATGSLVLLLTLRERIMDIRMPALWLVIASLSTPALAAQSEAPASGITACELLSSAEVDEATGRTSRKPPNPLVEAKNKWSHCSYRDADVHLGFFPTAKSAQGYVDSEVAMGGLEDRRHAVAGVGDSAAIYYRPKESDPRALLVAYAGTRALTVQVDGEPGQPSESARPSAVALAKTALAKLK